MMIEIALMIIVIGLFVGIGVTLYIMGAYSRMK